MKLLILLITLLFSVATPTIKLHTPSAYQVFQRDMNSGTIVVAGEVLNISMPVSIEAQWNGGEWVIVDDAVMRVFSGVLADAPQGQGTLTVRIAGTETATSVQYVGVGDVFVIAGQSNASGRGTRYQKYSHPTLMAGMLGNNYAWRELADPVDLASGTIDAVSNDSTAAKGSYWPLLATMVMQDQDVPVAFIPTAKGGSTIEQWQPSDKYNRDTLYGAMLNRALWAGGVRAVLWHQGENDALARTASELYAQQLSVLAGAIWDDLHVPLIPAQLQAISVSSPQTTWEINQGILLAQRQNTHVLAGPDLSDIITDDPAHLMTDAKLQEAARRWWEALKADLYE